MMLDEPKWLCPKHGKEFPSGEECPECTGRQGPGSMTTKDDGGTAVPGTISLADCPIGLFKHGETLALKTEYGSNEGRIDAYIVSTGEMFWGPPPQTIASQRACRVVPVEEPFSLNKPDPLIGALERIADALEAGPTLRDQMAIAALQAVISKQSDELIDDMEQGIRGGKFQAVAAYAFADAMLAARQPEKGEGDG